MGNTAPVADHWLPEAHDEMLSLRVLARLLDYPSAELQQAAGELVALIDAEKRWQPALRAKLSAWCQRIAEAELLDLQAEYVALFDKCDLELGAFVN